MNDKNPLYLLESSDVYEILGITPGTDEWAIKQAYRRLAKKYHPDANPKDPEAEKRFIRIQWAYDLLCAQERDADRQPSGVNSGFSEPDDIHPIFGF